MSLAELGIAAFAERVRHELRATGETAKQAHLHRH